jgi:hypothetical protein
VEVVMGKYFTETLEFQFYLKLGATTFLYENLLIWVFECLSLRIIRAKCVSNDFCR